MSVVVPCYVVERLMLGFVVSGALQFLYSCSRALCLLGFVTLLALEWSNKYALQVLPAETRLTVYRRLRVLDLKFVEVWELSDCPGFGYTCEFFGK